MNLGVALAAAKVTGLRVSPDGRVSIDGDSSAIAKDVVLDKVSAESQRATAILAVLYDQIPPQSDVGQALRRMGIGPK